MTRIDERWLASYPGRAPACLRLFCFPPAGAEPHVYRDWREHLPEWVELCVLHLPQGGVRLGAGDHDGMRPLMDAAASFVSAHGDIPFALFGQHFGALAGFEVCRRLRDHACVSPLRLFVAGLAPPRRRPASIGLLADEGHAGGTGEAALDHPISAYGGLQDGEADIAALVHWRERTRTDFTLRMFPGDRSFVQSSAQPVVRALLQDLALD